MGVGGQRHTLAALPPGEKLGTHFQEVGVRGGGAGPVRTVSKNFAPLPPPGFDPRTVQPVYRLPCPGFMLQHLNLKFYVLI